MPKCDCYCHDGYARHVQPCKCEAYDPGTYEEQLAEAQATVVEVPAPSDVVTIETPPGHPLFGWPVLAGDERTEA